MSKKYSHSSLSKFQTCPKSYMFRYINKLVSIYKSGALHFGTALDESINALLKAKMDGKELSLQDAKDIFDMNWTTAKDNHYQEMDLRSDTNVVYSASDFDSDLLDKSDYKEIFAFLNEHEMIPDIFENYKRIKEDKETVGWPNVNHEDKQFYNLCNWLSMRRKGHFMIECYYNELLPKIKKVLAIQQLMELENHDGDIIYGYADLVVEWEDGSICVLDNKTSSIDYELDSVKKSQQLAIYTVMLNEMASDKKNEWKHKVDKAGYLVLHKKLNKKVTKYCEKCGYVAEEGARHKTCNNEVDGTRCNGKWTRTVDISVKTQVIIDEIPEHTLDMVLENINDINDCIKNNIFPRNMNSCKQPWGMCDYYNKCWHGNEDSLECVKKKE